MIISHIKRNDLREDEWDIQSDVSHNAGVAALAEQFAEAFGFGSCGRVLGLLHDKGKVQQIFQRHIK